MSRKLTCTKCNTKVIRDEDNPVMWRCSCASFKLGFNFTKKEMDNITRGLMQAGREQYLKNIKNNKLMNKDDFMEVHELQRILDAQ